MNKNLWSKIVLPILAVIIIAAGSVFYFVYYEKSPTDRDKPPVPVDVAYAEDNFDLVPSDRDTLGVASDSYFTLTSQSTIEKSEVEESLAIEPAIDFDIEEVSPQE
ncbi:hypothetical protein KKI23_01505, partial [Patescibacteria group bacterium]|nr:hypothetical protein [Patescibacteria group bacterium]